MNGQVAARSVVRKVPSDAKHSLRTTLNVLGHRAPDVVSDIRHELNTMTDHLDAVAAFAARMKFGSSMPHHAEEVLSWLIERGWTPPPGVLLLDFPDDVDPEAQPDGEPMEETA